MDFYKFINSADIREYHRLIDYKCNSLEAAWLVYYCRDVSIKEKHEAWNWIIENMEDAEIPTLYEGLKGKKLHELLREYMELENADIEQFFDNTSCTKDTNYIYTIKEYTKMWDGKKGWYDVNAFFSSVDKCMEYIKTEMEDEESEDIEIVTIKKIMELDKDTWYDHIEADFRPDGTIMKIYYEVNDSDGQNKSDYWVRLFFERMWFYFPVPFKRGDIVRITHDGIPIVVDNIIFPNESEKDSFMKRKKECGDNSDMGV